MKNTFETLLVTPEIAAARPHFEKILATDFRVSEKLIAAALAKLGE